MQPPVQNAESAIHRAIGLIVARRRNGEVKIQPESALVEDLELDSLEIAELSQILQDDLGRDPYSEGAVPRTVGDIVAFYRD